MTAPDMIRRRLDRIMANTRTAAAIEPPAWWVGDTAGERKVHDDLDSGRLSWREAHRCALRGIAAIDGGDAETAEILVWAATDHYVAALEARVRPSDIANLGEPIARRGRPRGSTKKTKK